MTAVWTTTDEFPALAEHIAWRHERGLDTYDEWWNGVYRIVTGPSPEHGRLLNKLARLLDPLAEARGLYTSAPVNIGVDKSDCRVPDMGVYRPNTPRSSPAFLETAVLVVEVLSPGERAGEKLPFYSAAVVDEYLEIDLQRGTARLLVRFDGERWSPASTSPALGFEVATHMIDTGDRVVDLTEFVPER